MSKLQKRTRYSKEFKLDVIQQSYLRDNIRELANELGLRPELIYKWRGVYEGRSSEQTQFPGNGVTKLTAEQQKVQKLEAENAELRMERDILKKAIGIFGKKNG